MLNFGHTLFLVIFLCVDVRFLAYCGELKYDWKVVEDELKVEKMVVEYAEARKTSPAYLSTVPDEDKLFMCKAIIRLNYFGLEFQDDHKMDIDEHHVLLKRLRHKQLATDTLPMFQCPMLQYIDLETGELIDLLIKYFISGTHMGDSFFLYLQDGPDFPIYPHKFASDVKLVAFDELRISYDLVERDDKNNAKKMKVHSEVPEIEARLTEFIDSKELKQVYIKFRILFKSWVVCGMPRTHLIAACRHIAHNLDVEVDHRGYDEFNCRRRPVFRPPESKDSNDVFLGHLHTVKCPAVVSEVDRNLKKFNTGTLFLAANQRHRSVLVLKRVNLPGENVVLEAAISALKMPSLRKDRNRTREFLKPQYTERKPRFSDLTTNLILLSGLETRSRGPPSITFNRNAVEDNTIIFMRLKESKKPYDRFGASYMSNNPNTWSTKDVEFLCHLILQDESYNLDFEAVRKGHAKFEDRMKIQVQPAMRDTELLPHKNTAARQCPSGFQTKSTYFIVGTIYRDAIIVHVKYENNDYAFPEAYVQNINMAAVQTVTRNKNIFPSL